MAKAKSRECVIVKEPGVEWDDRRNRPVPGGEIVGERFPAFSPKPKTDLNIGTEVMGF